ncbi:MAG: AAA family ATPase [Acidimicrobiia bacterium]|nr:AAA family ATPase [Acidimicrobiia bacterium]
MSGITLATANANHEGRVIALYGKQAAVRRVWSDQWRDPAEAAADICAADPELVILGADLAADKARQLVPEIDRRFPAVTVLVLSQGDDTAFALDLLRLGARDVLDEAVLDGANPDATRIQALDRVFEVARSRHRSSGGTGSSPRRRVITVISPKGGTGKTTLATNLAVGLARRQPNQVALLDLDIQFGDCASALGLKPERSLVDAMKGLSHDRSALKVFLSIHPSGLAVLAPPDDLAAVDDIEADQLKLLISALAEEFPFLVIDTGSGIDPACVAALELSTDLLLLSTTDVPSIRALRRQVETLDRIGMSTARRTFVLNRANAKVGLSVGDVEAAVGMAADFHIPSSRLIPVSTNEGSPAIERDSGGVAAKFDEIAEHFAPRSDGAPRHSLFRALRKDR